MNRSGDCQNFPGRKALEQAGWKRTQRHPARWSGASAPEHGVVWVNCLSAPGGRRARCSSSAGGSSRAVGPSGSKNSRDPAHARDLPRLGGRLDMRSDLFEICFTRSSLRPQVNGFLEQDFFRIVAGSPFWLQRRNRSSKANDSFRRRGSHLHVQRESTSRPRERRRMRGGSAAGKSACIPTSYVC